MCPFGVALLLSATRIQRFQEQVLPACGLPSVLDQVGRGLFVLFCPVLSCVILP